MKPSINIFWFRRDLRLSDNAGLYHALSSASPVLPIFIFDRNILDDLENKSDPRVEFIYRALESIQKRLTEYQSTLEVYFGQPINIFVSLCEKYEIGKVFTNEDYEPYARDRDVEIENMLRKKGINFQTHKDQVIFSKNEILKEDGKPYTVFTPYSNKWKTLLNLPDSNAFKLFPSETLFENLFRQPVKYFLRPDEIGFSFGTHKFFPNTPDPDLIRRYAALRDYPGLDATSHLGIHLRFGTLSIRRLAGESAGMSHVFLNELIWRDFYQMILWHFPQVGKGHAFKPAYEKINWRNNEREFQLWCEGRSGYPMVDAAMRQLNETGFMHNRMRMLTASFLTKHLLIDWRWGEAYFAGKLLDYELASNNGGWQWAAGCGCDAAPYFRIFNPSVQQKKFDPEEIYIKKWLPDFYKPGYPEPVVEHRFARDRAVRVYKKALAGYGI
jgi:deoxyribodipyrimidine photo-lyase